MKQRLIIKMVLGVGCLMFALATVINAQAVGAAKPEAKDPASKVVKLDGSRVHYKNYGKGSEAIVFIHGWACNTTFWDGQRPAFEKQARTILIDLPGHGQSDKPETSYTMDLFARAVKAVLDDAGVKKAVLVGHSMGTPVIRQFYRKYPDQVRGLVIVDGALRPFGNSKMMEQFIAPLRGPNYREAVEKFINGMLGPSISAPLKEKIKASMLNTPQHVAVSAMDSMADPAIWTEDKINVPVLAVLAKTIFWPADNEQFFRKIAPDLDYQMWEGVSHFLMMEKPDEFNRAVTEFLKKTGAVKQT